MDQFHRVSRTNPRGRQLTQHLWRFMPSRQIDVHDLFLPSTAWSSVTWTQGRTDHIFMHNGKKPQCFIQFHSAFNNLPSGQELCIKGITPEQLARTLAFFLPTGELLCRARCHDWETMRGFRFIFIHNKLVVNICRCCDVKKSALGPASCSPVYISHERHRAMNGLMSDKSLR